MEQTNFAPSALDDELSRPRLTSAELAALTLELKTIVAQKAQLLSQDLRNLEQQLAGMKRMSALIDAENSAIQQNLRTLLNSAQLHSSTDLRPTTPHVASAPPIPSSFDQRPLTSSPPLPPAPPPPSPESGFSRLVMVSGKTSRDWYPYQTRVSLGPPSLQDCRREKAWWAFASAG